MPLLTGPAFGAAIRDALTKKKVTQKAFAQHFDVKPQSVQDWLNRGVVGKEKLFPMLEYFRDVVEPSHWGLQHYPPEMSALMGIVAERKPEYAAAPDLRTALQTMHAHARRTSAGTRAELRRLTDLYWTNPDRYETLIETMGDLLLGEIMSSAPNLQAGRP